MAAREWDVPKPAYRWQQNRQKFLSDRLQIDARADRPTAGRSQGRRNRGRGAGGAAAPPT